MTAALACIAVYFRAGGTIKGLGKLSSLNNSLTEEKQPNVCLDALQAVGGLIHILIYMDLGKTQLSKNSNNNLVCVYVNIVRDHDCIDVRTPVSLCV